MVFDHQIGDQLPENWRSSLRRVDFFGMDYLQGLMQIFLLLADWWTNRHECMPYREHGPLLCALWIAEPDLVCPTDLNFSHDLGNGRLTIFRQAVDATAVKKVCPQILCQTVKLIDVTFPVADVDTAFRGTGQLCGTAQIIRPRRANACFPFARWGHAWG